MLSGHRHQVQQGLQHRRWRASAAFLGARGSRRMEAAKIVSTLSQQVLDIHIRLREIDRDLLVWQRGNDVARRLMTIPALGQSERRHLPHRSPTHISFARGGSSPPGWD
jgi:hypothetical protein